MEYHKKTFIIPRFSNPRKYEERVGLVKKFIAKLKQDAAVVPESIHVYQYEDPDPMTDAEVFSIEWDTRYVKKQVKQHTWRRKIK